MSALSNRSCLTIKLSYVLMTAALLLNFISDAHPLNFKFYNQLNCNPGFLFPFCLVFALPRPPKKGF